ncbi:MAG: hypothetical protein HKM89_04700 [Gemmatimonadales bacterium]|nr:hypothetical protein [Gemmatimonadales bacterium]
MPTFLGRFLIPSGLLVAGLAPIGAIGPRPDCRSIKIGGSLPLPCSMPLADYERVLYPWLNNRAYAELGWVKDMHVRDTGPYLLGTYYGTHPAVRIYYSPEVSTWLENNRQGALPDGAMIVKEMFNPPAARYEQLRNTTYRDDSVGFETMLEGALSSWAIMIRDSQTRDGWFWAGGTRVEKAGKTPEQVTEEIAATLDNNEYPFNYRGSAFGLSGCLRCHSSAESEYTFSSLDNITGKELRFRVDNSWDTTLPDVQRPAAGVDKATLFLNAYHGNPSAATRTPGNELIATEALSSPNPEFTKYFTLEGNAPVGHAQVKTFPGQWADHVPASPDGAEQFITSDNCMSCHGGLGGSPSLITMFLKTGPAYGDGYNISPFGEWRWSPMGLAGRDPAFFAQLASEKAILENDFRKFPERFGNNREKLEAALNAVVNTCLSCHGAMGQRQLLIDALDDPSLNPNFKTSYVYTHSALTREEENQPEYQYHKYGDLAREGISCTICHHIDPPTQWMPGMSEQAKLELFLVNSTTGQFPYSPRGEISGPFDDVKVIPMENALGVTPVANPYIRDSRMCGTCHTINLPNVDSRKFEFPVLDSTAKIQAQRLKEQYQVDYAEVLTAFPHSIEQATFLEWQNSAFATDEKAFRSCQDCHMPGSFKSLDGTIDIPQLATQIATIQDVQYPEVDHELPAEDITIPVRQDYRRHEMVGLNAFLLEMFDQFDPILGVAKMDYMTSATTGNQLAIQNIVRQANHETIDLAVEIVSAEGNQLTADVTVTNLVGHRFPSGVGFRRTWIEFLVLDDAKDGEVVWASGRTNSVGLIVDGDGEPLPTEFFQGNRWQPHFHGIPERDSEEPTTRPVRTESDVQIYEEVVLDGQDSVTFSFIHRDSTVKDNRLLPRGWKESSEFESEILRQFMESTDPKGVGRDPDYESVPAFAGQDVVRYVVTLPDGVDSDHVTVQVTMYYQAFEPYWMKRRFQLSGDSPDTQRLYFLASHLNTRGTVIEDWKLPLVTVSASVQE